MTAGGWGDSEPDPRVTVIAPISAIVDATLQHDGPPSLYGGFTQEQIESINIPVLLLGGTEDQSVFIENNAIAYDWIPGTVYRADIIGADHTHFANICSIADFLFGLNIGIKLWPLVGAERLIEPYNVTCMPDVYPIADAQRLQNLYVTAFLKRHLLDMEESRS